jgi:hypothetical protein
MYSAYVSTLLDTNFKQQFCLVCGLSEGWFSVAAVIIFGSIKGNWITLFISASVGQCIKVYIRGSKTPSKNIF